jgi:hypothetical protein
LTNGLYPEIPYWQKALQYCLHGNLQAVLDEYVHILHEAEHPYFSSPLRERIKVGGNKLSRFPLP